jgi:hypothetical protein
MFLQECWEVMCCGAACSSWSPASGAWHFCTSTQQRPRSIDLVLRIRRAVSY